MSEQPLTAAAIQALIAAAGALGGTLDVHDDLVAGLAVPRDVAVDEPGAAIAAHAAEHPVRAWWAAGDEVPDVRP